MEVFVLKPETYMNLSGQAVNKFLELHEATPSELIVVVDDADLPFGELRLKAFGSSGGHNGLKNIEECLDKTSLPACGSELAAECKKR